MNCFDALRVNRLPFGLMPPDAQELAEAIGTNHFEFYRRDGLWCNASLAGRFIPNLAYRLKQDYDYKLKVEVE